MPPVAPPKPAAVAPTKPAAVAPTKPDRIAPTKPVRIAPLPSLLGQSLAHFQLEKIIHGGTTGMVFLATDKKNRKSAVKVLSPDVTKDEEEKQRFIRAVHTMMNVRHENLFELYFEDATRQADCPRSACVNSFFCRRLQAIGSITLEDFRLTNSVYLITGKGRLRPGSGSGFEIQS